MTPLLHFGLGLLAMTALTLGLQHWAGARLGWTALLAIVRASVQLAGIALVLHGVLSVPWTVALFLIVMLSTASWTSAGRLGELFQGRRAALFGVLAGAAAAIGAVFLLGLLSFDPRSIIALGGIVIGNCMTAATLTGRNFATLARTRRDEIEAWFAIGATPRQAHQEIARESLREALIPNLDQTKATGLVTLPGAFVGALIGGASPVFAAQFQLVVLAGIALAMTVTGWVVAQLVSRSPVLAAVAQA